MKKFLIIVMCLYLSSNSIVNAAISVSGKIKEIHVYSTVAVNISKNYIGYVFIEGIKTFQNCQTGGSLLSPTESFALFYIENTAEGKRQFAILTAIRLNGTSVGFYPDINNAFCKTGELVF